MHTVTSLLTHLSAQIAELVGEKENKTKNVNFCHTCVRANAYNGAVAALAYIMPSREPPEPFKIILQITKAYKNDSKKLRDFFFFFTFLEHTHAFL